eukprot:TRINITY_DN5599_c0_g1_i2.p1 TRINITY_DN5599_c0_g1~~TRINITY_DN5599_c0_g1_i2.p1  ORF type:complete len:343 (+),score=89.18 TRINITY_DN5599_c0_g1_i2:1-1029(+)
MSYNTLTLDQHFEKVKEAKERIKEYIHKTPVLTCKTIDEICSPIGGIFFKCEMFQKIGAFKMRGATNAVLNLSNEKKQKGIITHSSGNHAQALALAGKLLGIKTTVVMPENTPIVKLNATRDTYKANVVLCKSTIEARTQTTNGLIEKFGFSMIHPYDNINVIYGAGTCALELLEEIPDLEIILVPVGGGGLLSGTCISAKGKKKGIKVYGVEPKKVDDCYRSLKTGKIQDNKDINTIADGLRTNIGEANFYFLQKFCDGIILVEEEEIIEAMRLIWERMKVVVEPSGAVPLAALLSISRKDPKFLQGKKVGLILSGGNVNANVLFDSLSDFVNKNKTVSKL